MRIFHPFESFVEKFSQTMEAESENQADLELHQQTHSNYINTTF